MNATKMPYRYNIFHAFGSHECVHNLDLAQSIFPKAIIIMKHIYTHAFILYHVILFLLTPILWSQNEVMSYS